MLEYFMLTLGLVFLYIGAKYLIEGALNTAAKFGISSLAIGLTVVSIGTSAPELIVSIYASIKGSSDIIFGNIIGSNISNILLILGIVSILIPIKVVKSTVWKEIPFAIMAAAVLFILSNKQIFGGVHGKIIQADGILLLFFMAIFLYYAYDLLKNGKETITKSNHRTFTLIVMIIGGSFALFLGGKFTVDSAIIIARSLGLSELFISSTIIAIGTSLPELITSVVAAIKKNSDLAVGNIVGSNIINIFFVFALSAIISPIAIPAGANLDLIALLVASFLLFLFMFVAQKHTLKRSEGIVMVLLYCSYIILLFIRG